MATPLKTLFNLTLARLQTYYTSWLISFRLSPLYNLPPVYLLPWLTLVCSPTLLVLPTFAILSYFMDCSAATAVAMGWSFLKDLALPIGVCFFAALVSIVRNPMHSLLSLLGVFFTNTLIFLLAGIAFVGFVFLIVYVGAVAILFLFVIMLLNVKALTSMDELYKYLSQLFGVSACGGAFLHPQNKYVMKVNRAMGRRLWRDSVIEPTTGEAIFFRVRYQAMDVNGLVFLYTEHGVLFLVITGSLLTALLGAIVLATATTERALRVSDIRSSQKVVSTAPAAAVGSYAVAAAVCVFLYLPEDIFAILSVPPLIMSVYLNRKQIRDKQITKPQKYYLDSVVHRRKGLRDPRKKGRIKVTRVRRAHKNVLVTRIALPNQYLHFVRISFPRKHRRRPKRRYLVRRRTKKVYAYRLPLIISKLKKLATGRVSSAAVKQFCLRPGLLHLYLSKVVVAHTRQRYKKAPSARTITRYRWLWRWRRNRAMSLHRIMKQSVARETVNAKFRHLDWDEWAQYIVYRWFGRLGEWFWRRWFHYRASRGNLHWRAQLRWNLRRRFYDKRYPRKILQGKRLRLKHLRRSARSRLRRQYLRSRPEFDNVYHAVKLRSPLGWRKFSPRYIWSVQILPRLMFWAWRIRAFCVYFLCFFFTLPFLAVIVYAVLQDQWAVWADFCELHKYSSQFLFRWTELQHFNPNVSDTVAFLLSFPAMALMFVIRYSWLLVAVSICLAYDAVYVHAGDLSKMEFHESRCNYWRKDWTDVYAASRAMMEAKDLERRRRHPDKGRSDMFGDQFFELLAKVLPGWAVTIIRIWCFPSFLLIDTIETIYHSGASRCARAMIKNGIKSIWDSSGVRLVRGAFHDTWTYLCTEILPVIHAYLLEGWTFTWRLFYQIEYTPNFLKAIPTFGWHGTNPFTVVVFSLFVVALAYCLTSFIVLLGWRRTYKHTTVRRPPILRLFVLFFLILYVSAVCYRYTVHFFDLSVLFIYIEFHQIAQQYLREGLHGFMTTNPGEYFFTYFFIIPGTIYAYIVYFIVERWAISAEARVFRKYFNFWIRKMTPFQLPVKHEFDEEFATCSTDQAVKSLTAETHDVRIRARKARRAYRLRMKWIQYKEIPKYYDPHRNKKFRMHKHGRGFVTENHYKNPFHSS